METGLIVGLFVGIFLIIDTLCEICAIPQFARVRIVIKFVMGVALFMLSSTGLFLV